MFKKNYSKNFYIFISALLLVNIILSFCLSGVINKPLQLIIDAVWIAFFAYVVFESFSRIDADLTIRIIILCGVLARIGLVLWSILFYDRFSVFLNGGDQSVFLEVSMEYYNGIFIREWTKYPYIIFYVFRLFGPYRFMAQMVNIVLWFLGIKVLYAIAGNGFHGMKTTVLLSLYSLLPSNVLYTSGLYRESILQLFLMLSFFYIVKWQDEGKIGYVVKSIISAIPAAIMHIGSVIVLITLFLVFIFWNYKEQKWKLISWKTILFVLAIVFIIPVYDLLVSVFPGKLPASLSITSIQDNSASMSIYVPGRTDYIFGANVITTKVFQFAVLSLVRMFYLWISPAPWLWNSPVDFVAFMIDTIPWFVLLFMFFSNYKQDKNKITIMTGIILILLFSFIYGWGTRNAGTAMRHRNMLLGPIVLLVLYVENNITKRDNTQMEDQLK